MAQAHDPVVEEVVSRPLIENRIKVDPTSRETGFRQSRDMLKARSLAEQDMKAGASLGLVLRALPNPGRRGARLVVCGTDSPIEGNDSGFLKNYDFSCRCLELKGCNWVEVQNKIGNVVTALTHLCPSQTVALLVQELYIRNDRSIKEEPGQKVLELQGLVQRGSIGLLTKDTAKGLVVAGYDAEHPRQSTGYLAGVRRGDIIIGCQLNSGGTERGQVTVDSIKELMTLARAGDTFTVRLKRNRQDITIAIPVRGFLSSLTLLKPGSDLLVV